MFLGIDIGTASAKAVALTGDGEISARAILLAQGGDPDVADRLRDEVLDRLGWRGSFDGVVATGCGRLGVRFPHRAVSEILCQARGVTHFLPATAALLDVGARDGRLVVLDRYGEPEDFVIEHECVAGMRRLLALVRAALEEGGGEGVEETLGPHGVSPGRIEIDSSSMVCAGHQVVTMLAGGEPPGEIVAAIERATAARLARLLAGRCGREICGELVLTGGLALQEGIVAALGEELGVRATVAPEPELTGAIGAAVIARATARRDSRWTGRPNNAKREER